MQPTPVFRSLWSDVVAYGLAGLLVGALEAFRFLAHVRWHAWLPAAVLHLTVLTSLAGLVIGGLICGVRTLLRRLVGSDSLLPLLTGMLVAVALAIWPLQKIIAGNFQNQHLTALVQALIGAFTALVGAFFAMVAARVLRAWRFAPATLASLVIAALVGFAFWFGEDLEQVHMPWALHSLLLIAAGAGLRFARLPTGKALRWVLATVVGLNVVLVFGPHFQPGHNLALTQQTPLAFALIEAGRKATDFDGDGFSGWLGHGDCAAFDAKINPAADDIVRNRIDEDCDGKDAQPDHFNWPRPKPSTGVRPSEGLSAILISVDALRRDHLSIYGYPRPTTPSIDRLAARGVRFRHSFAISPQTRYSLAGLLFGVPFNVVRWQPLPKGAISLPANLKGLAGLCAAEGIKTVAVLDCFRIFKPYFGLNRGFGTYDTHSVCVRTFRVETKHDDQRTDTVIGYLKPFAQSGQRFFLWVHYLDPHAPYRVPAGQLTFGTEPRDQYDGVVHWTDKQVGRLLEYLDRSGLAQRTAVVLTGDHGEEFGEHGGKYHGRTLYSETIAVPLIVAGPGIRPRVLDTPVGHLDVMPTLLDLLGVPGSKWPRLWGRNLAPLLSGAADRAHPAWVFALNAAYGKFRTFDLALFEPPWTLLSLGSQRSYELYDLHHDFYETTNLFEDGESQSAAWKARAQSLRRFLAKSARQ